MSSKDVGILRTRLSWEDDGANQSLQGFRNDLRGLRSEMNVARSQGQQYTQSLRGMREQSDILTRRLQTQREQVQALRQRYEESARTKGENARQTQNLRNQVNNATAAMNRTEQQLKQLTAEIERQTNPWHRLSEAADQHGRKLQSIGSQLTSFGRAYSLRVTAPILTAGAAALKVGMDFEEGMSKVQALTGATGSTLERLKEQAKELGATTRFSATESADAMSFLAMAGWEAQEIMAGMPGLLNLAAAGNMELARAADITSNIMSAFNIEAEKAGIVSDILAKAASSANTDVGQLGEAMKYLAPSANTLGMSIEDSTAAVMAFSDAGIQGSMAGRAFGTSLTRLANPTAAMQKEMDRLKVTMFDSEGAMKPLPVIVEELEQAMAGMTKEQRAATLSTIFGNEAQRHWAILLERGSGALKENTEILRDSEGAAQRMADIMSDNARGGLREFRSALESAGIAASEHMLPAFTEIISRGTDLIRTFGELDDETQQQIIRWALIAAAVGPASLVMGNMATTAGTLLTTFGRLSGSIAARGGLVAALGSLTNPVTATIAIVAALAAGIYVWNQRTNAAREVNLDLALSLKEQSNSLEDLTTRYDELNRTSRLTTEEFGRLRDIQSELERTQDAAKIEQLQAEYEKLAEKSGLSNEELLEMLGLNDQIIEQSPVVEQTFTSKGNAIVKSTDAVHEYIQSLRDMAFQELQIERFKALDNEKKMREENIELNRELREVEREISNIIELRKLTEEDILHRLEEINKEKAQRRLHGEAMIDLIDEEHMLQALLVDQGLTMLESLQKRSQELRNKIELNDEELAKLEQIEQTMAELLLAEVGLNYERGEGLNKLDERINKLKEEKDEILNNASEEEWRNGIAQERIDKLNEEIRQHERVREKISENTGYQSNMNTEAEIHERRVNQVNFLLEDMRRLMNLNSDAQRGTNRQIDQGTSKAKDMTAELGKDVRKRVDVDDRGTAARVQREAEKPASKRVTLNAVWTNVQQGLTTALTGAISRFSIPGFAEGTDYHRGGLFVAGEEGYELGRLGNRWEMLDFGLYNRPAGYQVFTHDESKQILNSLNNLPAYATGARPPGEADRVVRQLSNQQRSTSSDEIVIYTTVVNQMDGREISRYTYRHVSEMQERDRVRREQFAT